MESVYFMLGIVSLYLFDTHTLDWLGLDWFSNISQEEKTLILQKLPLQLALVKKVRRFLFYRCILMKYSLAQRLVFLCSSYFL